jgi:hypothetical protein
MKSIIAIVALGATTLGFATQADAFKLSPPSTSFTASGPTSLSAGGATLACTSTFTGHTTAAGVGKITGFSASGQAGCSSIVATLPWTAKAVTATAIVFSRVAVAIPGLVTCGPGRVRSHDNASGAVTFNATLNPGNCTVSGTVQSSPVITIVP